MLQRLSPLHHEQVALNATLTEVGGWVRPERYGTPEGEAQSALRSVGVRDISPLEKVDVKGSNLDSFLKGATASVGSPGSVLPGRSAGFDYVCRLTEDHALAIGGG